MPAKWGSVDEKYPFLYHNIEECYPYPTIIILVGRGYRKAAAEWLKKRIPHSKNLKHVFTMEEFQKWANNGNI